MLRKIKNLLVGSPQNPMAANLRGSILLVAFYAWVGLGSDGLSSVNYGPEEAFRALGAYPMLGIYLAIAIMVTVFIIASAYNQVIELFPTGGGGYKVANQLLHPYAGLVSGVALLVDYVLTIAISAAAAIDALFSLFPASWWPYRLVWKVAIVLLLMIVNLRGMKESIRFMMPIFLGFVITHVVIIIVGLFNHEQQLPVMVHNIAQQSHAVIHNLGWAATLVLLLKAYSLGAGTYTGLEAVSNNVNVLAEPQVRTGKWTMFYMAGSLSLMAGGIILMYMLWNVQAAAGHTYNSSLFNNILAGVPHHHLLVLILMAFEAGILVLGANTGYLGGPAVLANMAVDKWVPAQFGNLSSRLVKQNGIIAMALIAVLIMVVTRGHVRLLVILYSTTVFLTFSLSLFALVRYWLQFPKRHNFFMWLRKFLTATIGFIICLLILIVIVAEKFFEGGWLTLLVMTVLIYAFLSVRRHYQRFAKKIDHVDYLLTKKELKVPETIPQLVAGAPTAVVFVNRHIGLGVHTLLWINRLFPHHFKNYIFIQVGEVDIRSFSGADALEKMKQEVESDLDYYVRYMHSVGAAAECYADYGTHTVDKLYDLALEVGEKYPEAIYFSTKIILTRSKMKSTLLHNKSSNQLQEKLHGVGRQMILLPMNIRM